MFNEDLIQCQDCGFLGHDAVQSGRKAQTFRRNHFQGAKWMQQVPLNILHGITPKKTIILIFTNVRI